MIDNSDAHRSRLCQHRVVLAILVGHRAELTRERGGKILAFATLFVLPAVAVGLGYSATHGARHQARILPSCHVNVRFRPQPLRRRPELHPGHIFKPISFRAI